MNNKEKENFGIVYTPEKLVDNILDLIPIKYYCDPSLTWLDIGAGNGGFAMRLYDKLFKHLKNKIKNDEERKKHIIKNIDNECWRFWKKIGVNDEWKKKFNDVFRLGN